MPATWKLPYLVTARYAGNTSTYEADADDRDHADQLAAAALRAGYHHASIKSAGELAGQYTEIAHLTRDPRPGDRIVGHRTDAPDDETTLGVVTKPLADGHLRLDTGEAVTFVRYAIPGAE